LGDAMSAPRDPWADFAAVFAEELAMTTKTMDAMADNYQREQLASANSGTEDEPAEDLG
jgi:hypothetical protein